MTSFITAVLSFAVVGALVSLIIEVCTAYLSKTASKVVTLAISLVAGVTLMFIFDSSYADAFLTALGAASTVYAFIIKK
jgi:hypothetical protein